MPFAHKTEKTLTTRTFQVVELPQVIRINISAEKFCSLSPSRAARAKINFNFMGGQTFKPG
eukprot:1932437-Karenia_brevis.AAC.1